MASSAEFRGRLRLYLLDTNVVSEFRKPRPHGGVAAWVAGQRPQDLFIAAVTLGEIQRGLEITRRQDTAKAREIEAWLDALPASANVLDMTGADFRRHARMMFGRTAVLANDAMIAAMVINRNLIVATRNVRDFADLETAHFDPFA